MDSFPDYYALLGVDANATSSGIKAAFKKLALQYHPDIYKGEDAEERMRALLMAYQTLSDPQERKAYDARRAEHMPGVSAGHGYVYSDVSHGRKRASEVSPHARRDRQRHYSFPSLADDHPARFELGESTYSLSSGEAQALRERGMLRGVDVAAQGNRGDSLATRNNYPRHCHRCQHNWTLAAQGGWAIDDSCPACRASDWGEYLLLRCVHCHAVFESEQIRYEVGALSYGGEALCPPYELFPLCPYCGAASWCPAEDTRVDALRATAARRAAITRVVVICLTVAVVVMLAVLLLHFNI